MKIGMKTPNFKKSIKARTTGKVKRKIKIEEYQIKNGIQKRGGRKENE